jgi:hypothetical protein
MAALEVKSNYQVTPEEPGGLLIFFRGSMF